MVQYGTVAQVAAHGANGRCRYKDSTLARPMAQLEQVLLEIAGVHTVQAERDRASFEFHKRAARTPRRLARRARRRTAGSLGVVSSPTRLGSKKLTFASE